MSWELEFVFMWIEGVVFSLMDINEMMGGSIRCSSPPYCLPNYIYMLTVAMSLLKAGVAAALLRR